MLRTKVSLGAIQKVRSLKYVNFCSPLPLVRFLDRKDLKLSMDCSFLADPLPPSDERTIWMYPSGMYRWGCDSTAVGWQKRIRRQMEVWRKMQKTFSHNTPNILTLVQRHYQWLIPLESSDGKEQRYANQ